MANHFLPDLLVGAFILLFALLTLFGMMRLIQERKVFGSGVLMVSALVFVFSTWVAATLKI